MQPNSTTRAINELALRPPVRVAGPGDPDCPECRGGGSTVVTYSAEEVRKKPYLIFDAVRDCRCVRERDVVAQLDRTWRGLSKAAPVARSPLASYLGKDLWVRCSGQHLRVHLARVLRDHPGVLRNARVVTDADLLNAEFSWKRKAEDDDSSASIRPVDLYGGRKIVVLILGIEEKRDHVTPGLVLTCLRDRGNSSLPTWIVDTTDQPIQPGHLSYSSGLERELSQMDKVLIGEDGVVTKVDEFAEVAKTPETSRSPRSSAPAVPQAAAAPVEIDPVLEATMRRLGIEKPEKRGKGAAGPCQMPGCKGTLHGFLAQDGTPIVGCSSVKCVTTHKVKGVMKTHVTADRYFDLLQEAKQPKVPEEDDAAPATPSQGKQVLAAVAKIRGLLAQGPRPRKLVMDSVLESSGRSTYYRAIQDLGVIQDLVDGTDMLRLPTYSSTVPPAASPADVSSENLGEIDSLLDSLK